MSLASRKLGLATVFVFIAVLSFSTSAVSYAQWGDGDNGIVELDDPNDFKRESPNYNKNAYDYDYNGDGDYDNQWDNRGVGHMDHTQQIIDDMKRNQ